MPLTKIVTGVIADNTITSTDIATGTIVSGDIDDGTIVSGDMALDPRNASNLNSGAVPSAQLGNVDTTGLQDDIALLAFKTQANGSLARYNLVDQSVDSFEDASGVDASASTDEFRNAAGKYYSGNGSGSNASNHTTTGSDTFVTPSNLTGTGKVLVVGGGGGSQTSSQANGGGGAGGLVYVSNYALVASTTYNLTIGAGAAALASGNLVSTDGLDSVFDTSGTTQILTAEGGGGGGGVVVPRGGRDGGSGGGAGNGTYDGSGGSSTQPADFGSYTGVGFGNDGGDEVHSSPATASGGGGAGAVGADSVSTSVGGAGGAGKDYSAIFGTGVGDSGWFAGGGGGASVTGGAGGQGGGGRGGNGAGNGVAGTNGTGGGVGGEGTDSTSSLTGGDGGIYILYDTLSYADMTLISNAQTAVDGAPDTADLVMTYTDGAGTATINTDIKAYVSRNGSAYSSAVTLVSQGTTGGHTILTANSIDVSGITSGTSMRWKIETLNQSASKDTRIHAVSLGWA